MKRILFLFAAFVSTLVVFAGNSLSDGKYSQKIFDFSQPWKASQPVYDPRGKPDPFKSIFSDGSNNAAPRILQSDCISNPVLEKLSLSQLELSGIVLTEHHSIALVQEADGKGHMITEDMCIGTQGGKVAEILNDRIIVQFSFQDTSGNAKVMRTEMKLKRRAN